MEPTELTTWINANGGLVGLVSGLVGFWAGFRSNLWIARRAEWNAVVDRVRAALLNSRQYQNWELRVADSDIDQLLVLANRPLRGRIQAVVRSHADIRRQSKRGSLGQIAHTEEQIAQMKALREKLLELVRRR